MQLVESRHITHHLGIFTVSCYLLDLDSTDGCVFITVAHIATNRFAEAEMIDGPRSKTDALRHDRGCRYLLSEKLL